MRSRGKGGFIRGVTLLFGVLLSGALMAGPGCAQEPPERPSQAVIALPPPELTGEVSLEETIANRRSRRSFTPDEVGLPLISQLLWAAQGITEEGLGLRSAPSAGATYPLEVMMVLGASASLEPGVYRYRPDDHTLRLETPGDRRTEIAAAALDQGWIADALGLATVVVGAFRDRELADLLGLPSGQEPLAILPLGVHP